MTRYGLAIDISRCIGCYACVIACKSENSTRPGVSWIRVEQEEQGEYPNVSRSYWPVMCVECGEMPCAQVCPNGAIHKGDGGIVFVDHDKCDCGTKLCVDACPFGAMATNEGNRSYFADYVTPYEKEALAAHREGTVEKCMLCYHRIRSGDIPACVRACPAQAMVFGDLDDRDSPVTRLIARGTKPLGTHAAVDPAVFYL